LFNPPLPIDEFDAFMRREAGAAGVVMPVTA
jgi:hypothetical protein